MTTIHFWHVLDITKAFEKPHGLYHELPDLPVKFTYSDNSLSQSSKSTWHLQYVSVL